MVFRAPRAAPRKRVEESRRGPVVGRYCLVCNSTFPLQRGQHRGKPIHGRDHIAAPCPNEGFDFTAGAGWWDLAVEVLPPPPEPVPADAAQAPGPVAV
jgi:hypothetical protein